MTLGHDIRRRIRRFVLAGAVLGIMLGAASCPLDPWDDPVEARLAGVSLIDAFPAHRFHRPILVTWAPGDPDGLYVAEQHGEIHRLDRTRPGAAPRLFADISDRVSRRANETGLLGVAFHPRFEDNGRVFMHYSRAGERAGVVSEFRAEDGAVVPGSESELLRQGQPFLNHNGGMIAFGPDGFLYISFGDGGSQGDPQGNGQRLDTWLGKILRIDVDRPGAKRPWSVPRDNPLVGEPGVRPQIWAWGLRNMWRFSFDRATGRLWGGDVGQNRYEEIDIVTRGGNYGWNLREGFAAHPPAGRRDSPEPARRELIEPVAAYGIEEGRSVTGGHVYRGAAIPSLQGAYVFGDFASGRVWALTPSTAGWRRELVAETHRPLSSFGEDVDGELYVTAFDGAVYRFVPSTGPPAAAPLPRLLTDLDFSEGYAGPVEYEVRLPFWSDGLVKRRWVYMPADGRIEETLDGPWVVPVGTVLVKEFHEPDEDGFPDGTGALEVRVIRRAASGWQAASYVDPEGEGSFRRLDSSIELPRADGSTWQALGSGRCWTCHAEENGFLLGLTSAQIPPDSRRALASGGLLQPSERTPRLLPLLDDPATPVAGRARAWLHVNCAGCHQPGGRGNAAIDLRRDTPLPGTGLIDVEPGQGDLGVRHARLVAPGDVERSILHRRIATRGTAAMPPLGSHIVDPAGVRLVRDWIESLER